MKIKNIIIAVAIAALTPLAMADVTINITGSTAMRSALHNSIVSALGGSGSVSYAFSGATLSGASYGIFVGTVASVSGTVTVRTSFSGSVEGIRDVSQQNNVSFLPIATTTSTGAGTANAPTGSNVSVPAQIAMSDIFSSTTNYTGVTGEKVSVITFGFAANNGRGGNVGLTNITPQQFRLLAGSGFTNLAVFTGAAADATKNVYLTGRNDGSGTRVTFLAETGYGCKNLLSQFKLATSGGAITSLQVWPTGDGSNASIIFNTDTAGNGGYSSGGTMQAALNNTSTASANILDSNGSVLYSDSNFAVIGYMGTSDLYAAVTAGATQLSYNGITIGVNSSSITTPDLVTTGQYTLWGYEQAYYVTGTKVGDLATVFNAIKGQIPANVGKTGVTLASMTVSRSTDGGLVGP